MKKIVFFTLSPVPYGNNIADAAGFRIWGLANCLKKSNEVTICTLYNSYVKGIKKVYDDLQDGLAIKEIPYQSRSVAKTLNELKPDLLIFSNWSSFVFASWFRSDVPVVMDYVGASFIENLMSKRTNPFVLSRLKLRSFQVADYITTTTHRLRYYLIGSMIRSNRLQNYDMENPLVNVVPIFPPSAPLSKTDASAKNDGEFVILLPGAVVPWYDYNTVLEALSKLKKVGKKFKLVIMGDATPSLKWGGVQGILQTCKALGLNENVTVTGLVPFNERAKYFLNADIAIVPNRNTLENDLAARTRVIDCLWGNLPIVTPGGDEYSEMAIQSGCAFRYLFYDHTDLCRVLENLVDNYDILEASRKKIASFLLREFDPKLSAKPLIKFIEESTSKNYPGSLHSTMFGLLPYIKSLASYTKTK